VLLPDGRVAAPAGAPAAVKVMIAAGNQLVGLPYVWGGGHTRPPSELVGGYDCSGAVSRILYEAGLLPGDWAETSGELESFGRPGPGRWVTLYASPAHVFMYVADVRWDTHDAAGPGDGSVGLGWHPLVRDASGFVARHPEGL
jgi:cell wall-associated NlpC family hydrolase